jgi:hypothetical protein
LAALQSLSTAAVGAYWVSPSRLDVAITGHLHGISSAVRFSVIVDHRDMLS